MLASEQIEELITVLASMDRATLVKQMFTFASTFPVDFTADFLMRLSEEKLRHIFLALCLQNQRVPEMVSMQIAAPAAA